MTDLSEPDVFVLADRALLAVVEQVAPDQWSIELPEWFPLPSRHRGTGMDLRTLINYHAYDDAWVPDVLAGRTMDEAGRERFDGDLLGEDPATNFAALVVAACTAAAAVEPADLDTVVHLSFGDFSMRDYFLQVNQFRALRARDIARVIGADETLPVALVEGIWHELQPNIEAWRKIGIFGPAVDVPGDAPLQDRLMALTGRQP